MSKNHYTGTDIAKLLDDKSKTWETHYRYICREIEKGEIEKIELTIEDKQTLRKNNLRDRNYVVSTEALISYLKKRIRSADKEHKFLVKKLGEVYRG